jgi:hypothetical protein
MTRYVARVLIGATVFGVLAVVSVWWSSVLMSAALLAALAWQMARCRHTQPLGLLPPIMDERGQIVPARWYCDTCGKSWPAMFERGKAPVRRFIGYDQSKAVAAARRADELVEGQRALALKRAGIRKSAHLPSVRVKSVPPRPQPVSIQSRRIAG